MVLSGIETDVARANYLKLCLEIDSPADTWFQALDAATQGDWSLLELQFTQRWANRQHPRHVISDMERTDQLLNHRINPEDVGKLVPFLGDMEYSHVVWAEEMIAWAKQLGLESQTEYLYQVMNMLPDTIRDNIKSQPMNWTTFTDTVRDIKIRDLQQQAKREKEQQERDKATQACISKLNAEVIRLKTMTSSPTAMAHDQHRRPEPQKPTTSAERATATTPGHYEAQQNKARPLRTPVTDADRAALQQQLCKYPHQPDTENGWAAYMRQIAQWSTGKTTSNLISHDTPVPLRPGTAAICSGECFRCGTHRHRAIQCNLGENHPNRLRWEESSWRAICSIRLGPVNRVGMSEVHLVFSEQEEAQPGGKATEEEHEEGKGEGPSA